MAVVSGPFVPTELAGVFEYVGRPHADVIRALGSDTFFDDRVIDAGRAALLIRLAMLEDARRMEATQELAEVNRLAREIFVDPGPVYRVGVVEDSRSSCQILFGNGRLAVTLVPAVGYLVSVDPDASLAGSLGSGLLGLPASSGVVIERIGDNRAPALSYVKGLIGYRASPVDEWALREGNSLDSFVDLFAAEMVG